MKPDDRESHTWSALMRTANRCYHEGHYDSALSLYSDALALVDDVVGAGALCRAVLMAKVVSHHNRGAAWARLGRCDAAEREFAAAHGFVRSILEDPATSPDLREAARCHCAVTWGEWRAFRREYRGEHDERPASTTTGPRPVVH